MVVRILKKYYPFYFFYLTHYIDIICLIAYVLTGRIKNFLHVKDASKSPYQNVNIRIKTSGELEIFNQEKCVSLRTETRATFILPQFKSIKRQNMSSSRNRLLLIDLIVCFASICQKR